MSQSELREPVLDVLGTRLDSWAPARRSLHGFDHLVGAPDHLRRLHRAHARTVLASEAVLAEISGSQRVVLMKGLEVAQLYESPLQRPFRDVDVLLAEPRQVWDACVARGYRANPRRRIDIDHHHLPALAAPSGAVGLELHQRPNTPAWAHLPAELILETAEPSRTGIAGIDRPRDDLHALLLALHGWKGGFTRLRDLVDALLLAEVSEVPVEDTAAALGLSRFWRWTRRIVDIEIFGRSGGASRAIARAIVPNGTHLAGRRRARVLAPYLVAGPITVTRGHLDELRLGRAARRGVGAP